MSAALVKVDLGPRSYDITIGDNLLGAAAAHLQPQLASPRVVIVSDQTVAGLYRDKINLEGLAVLSRYPQRFYPKLIALLAERRRLTSATVKTSSALFINRN